MNDHHSSRKLEICYLDHVNNHDKGRQFDFEKEEDDRGVSSPTTVCFETSMPPCQKKQKVETVHDWSSNTKSSCHVGKFVAVYWPDDDVYYRGKIARKRKSGQFLVKYEDGDSEWVDPDTTIFQQLVHKNEALPPRKVSPSLDQVIIGSRLLVWWPVEEQYFEATVANIDTTSLLPFELYYDDGDHEWTELANRNFVFQE
jgi:hypothetical protein